MNVESELENEVFDLNVNAPEDAIEPLRRAVDSYRLTAKDFLTTAETKQEGLFWLFVAQVLENAANKIMVQLDD